jgi:hypothetical protein
MFLHFEEWSAADLDRFATTRLWVRVKGCPYKERCDYLALFAVGSLIGKAVEVDMEFTREWSIVRMLVDVTRPEFIPKTTVDHVYEGDVVCYSKLKMAMEMLMMTLIWMRRLQMIKIINKMSTKDPMKTILMMLRTKITHLQGRQSLSSQSCQEAKI